MDKIKRHAELCQKLQEVYEQKNNAYGDSFGKSFADWGISAACVRMGDKWNRIVNLAKHPDINHGDEAITDSLVDLANYCLMTVMELENNGNN
jgi:hypothetical protein